MIGASTVSSWASSRCETSRNVRSRTSSITACSSTATVLNIQASSLHPVKRYGPLRPVPGLNRTSDEAAEPQQREAAGGDQQRDRAAREHGRDLALLALGGEPRAEVGVDLLDLVGLGRGVGLAARNPRDLLQRLRVRRDL